MDVTEKDVWHRMLNLYKLAVLHWAILAMLTWNTVNAMKLDALVLISCES